VNYVNMSMDGKPIRASSTSATSVRRAANGKQILTYCSPDVYLGVPRRSIATTATAPSPTSRRSRAFATSPQGRKPQSKADRGSLEGVSASCCPISTTMAISTSSVANDSTENFLFMNEGGPALHEEQGDEQRRAVRRSGQDRGLHGHDFADVDGDGDFDLIA
jgi:hypothetical protein